MSPFSELVRAYRVNRGLTQKELADLMGFGQSLICAVERGGKYRAGPSPAFVRRFLSVANLPPDEQAYVERAVRASNRVFVVPKGAQPHHYELVQTLFQNASTLDPRVARAVSLLLDVWHPETAAPDVSAPAWAKAP